MNQFEDGRVLIGPPKSDAGRRVVAIPPHILPAIEDHLLDHVGPGADALVFTGSKGGPLRYAMLDKAWRQARIVAELTDLHLHDLRHASNTWAATTGASTKELMARMGHACAAAALRYQHATADRDRAIARALSGLARPAGATSIGDARAVGGLDA